MKPRLVLQLALAAAATAGSCLRVASPPVILDCFGTCGPCSAPVDRGELTDFLKLVYQRRDYDCFASLLHPDFAFEFDLQPTGSGTTWDREEELRIHRRMFQPAEIAPPEPLLPAELWLASIDITLVAATDWDSIPGETGVFHIAVNADLFFETQGDTDFRVHGQQDFAVQLDRTKPPGDPGRLLLIHWTDLGTTSPAAMDSRHGVKLLHRTPQPAANSAVPE